MGTTVVLNNFPKINIFVTMIKIGFYTIFVVAMVSKFYFVLQNLTFLCFNLHSSMCILPLKGTLCHLVSCGGTKW